MSRFSALARRVSGPGADAWEIHRLARERIARGDDIVLLTIGEDVSATTPPEIVERTVESLHAGRHHYPAVEGVLGLRTAIARRHVQTRHQAISADNVVVFAGAQNALFAVALSLLDPGDRVAVVEPYYSTYPATFTATGSELVSIPADPSAGMVPNLDELDRVLAAGAKLLVINSPNNPTGAVYEPQRMQAILELCRAHGCWLLSDEVYAEFVFDATHVSPARYAEPDDRLVIVSSLSKSHRMAGFRVGWAVVPIDLAAHLTDLNLAMTYGLPPFIQDAAEYAIDRCDTVPDTMATDYAERARRVMGRIGGVTGLDPLAPKAGMFVVLNVAATGVSGEEFAKRLLDQYGVAILPCASFGKNLDQYLRMSLCADSEGLERACSALISLSHEMTTSAGR